MKKYLIPVLCFSCSIIVMLFFTKKVFEKQKSQYLIEKSQIIGENRFLKDKFNELIVRPSQILEPVNIKTESNDSTIKLYDAIDLPCLITYTPSPEGSCMSCIDYAIESVAKAFPSFSTSRHFCIISYHQNPEIRERIYKKKVYFIDQELKLSMQEPLMPCYFLLTKDKEVTFPFTPNSQFPEFTQQYLNRINDILVLSK